MFKDKRFTISISTILVIVFLLTLIGGSLFNLLLARQQRRAEEANMSTVTVWSNTVTGLQRAATIQVKATAAALTEASTATTEAWSTNIANAQTASVGELVKTVTIQAEATSIAFTRATATAQALAAAATVVVNQLIPLNQHTIAIDERNIIGDEITIDIVAVDVDDQSIDEELLGSLVEVLIDYGSIGTASKFKKLSSLIPFVEEYVERVQKPLEDYFDLIGQDKIILRRSERWGAGPLGVYRRGGGLNIKYRVYLTDKAPIPSTEWPR
jgi:hypothetical protein